MDNDVNEPFLHYKDDESQIDDFGIQHKIREGFISKVYGIIAYQIVLTSIVVYLGFTIPSFKELLLKSISLYYICFFISLLCVLLPICDQRIYQEVPKNYIILTIFTLSYSWLVAEATCQFTMSSVMLALFLTFITVVTLSVFAMKTKNDFTIYGGILSVCLVLLIFFSIFYLILPITLYFILMTYVSLILFAFYLIYDTQLLIGSGKIKFSEDDYILAAINIYLDVIIIFLKILAIVGKKE